MCSLKIVYVGGGERTNGCWGEDRLWSGSMRRQGERRGWQDTRERPWAGAMTSLAWDNCHTHKQHTHTHTHTQTRGWQHICWEGVNPVWDSVGVVGCVHHACSMTCQVCSSRPLVPLHCWWEVGELGRNAHCFLLPTVQTTSTFKITLKWLVSSEITWLTLQRCSDWFLEVLPHLEHLEVLFEVL